MKHEDFEKLQSSMSEKLGNDTFALISDDIATIMSDNNAMNNDIKTRDEKISRLEKEKDNLIQTNGNLMQKISVGFEEPIKTPDDNRPKYVLNDAFDEKGHFKK